MKLTSRILAFSLALLLTLGFLCTVSAAQPAAKTPWQAVREMSWGVNLTDLFIADVPRYEDNPIGYVEDAPFGLGIWFWNEDYDWLTFIEAHERSFSVQVALPSYVPGQTSWVGQLFQIGAFSYTKGQTLNFTLSNAQIVKANGGVVSLSGLNGTYDQTTTQGPNDHRMYNDFLSFDGSALPKPGSEFNGATLHMDVTVNAVPFISPEAKAQHFYQLGRNKMDAQKLTDVFLDQGANVIRLPVTWSSFVNDETFLIDEEWLKLIQKEVDYILDSGAYCILNTHNDYLQYSFVGDRWTRDWMHSEYAEYVNARFVSIWTQIANYFKDYPDTLIFEPFNEPTMYYTGANDFEVELRRVNELNHLFVDTIRSTGGNNRTRLLTLAVANYNNYQFLNDASLVVPKDDYVFYQLHSYNAMESDPNMSTGSHDYRAATDALFAAVDTFLKNHPTVPVLIGETGVTHRQAEDTVLESVQYFYQEAEERGIPCLWWEDFFWAEDKTQYWLYNKDALNWGRPQILSTIRTAVTEPLGVRVQVGQALAGAYLDLPESTACTVYAALYSPQGQLLALDSVQRPANQARVQLTLSAQTIPSGSKVRFFALDGQHLPLCQSVQRPIR